MDIDSWIGGKDSDNWDEMLSQTPWHLIQRPHHKWWGPEQSHKCSGVLHKFSDYSEDMEVNVIWACHEICRICQNNPAMNCNRKKKEMGGQNYNLRRGENREKGSWLPNSMMSLRLSEHRISIDWSIDWWKIFLLCGNSFQQKM